MAYGYSEPLSNFSGPLPEKATGLPTKSWWITTVIRVVAIMLHMVAMILADEWFTYVVYPILSLFHAMCIFMEYKSNMRRKLRQQQSDWLVHDVFWALEADFECPKNWDWTGRSD